MILKKKYENELNWTSPLFSSSIVQRIGSFVQSEFIEQLINNFGLISHQECREFPPLRCF